MVWTQPFHRVMVDGLEEGEPAGGGANPAHVHRGTCEEPIDAETYEIGQLKGPVAEADIDVPISDLVGGGYVVEVHLPPAPGRAGRGEVIGCAELADAEPAAG